MLTMPTDWRQFSSGAIVTDLLEQISPPLRRDFVRYIIGASLELLIAGICKTHRAVIEGGNLGFAWEINDTTYVYFPDVDDDALEKAVEIGSHLPPFIIIVPSGFAEILNNACRHKLISLEDTINPGRTTGSAEMPKIVAFTVIRNANIKNINMPLIFPLDSFISFRTSFTGADLKWTKNRVLLELFRRYNRELSMQHAMRRF